MEHLIRFIICLFFIYSLSFCKPIDNSSYSSIVVFGASYCDNGHARANKFSYSLRSPPYYHGRWSNGPVWVEHISQNLGIPLFNYAYGGATPNNDLTNGGVPDTLSQIENYLTDLQSGKIQRPRGRVLHLIWVGINSIHHIWNSGLSTDRAIAEAEEVKKQFVLLLNNPIINSSPSEFHALTLPPLQIIPNDILIGIRYAHDLDENGGIQGLVDAYNYHLIKSIRNLNSQYAFVHQVDRFWFGIHNNPGNYGFKHVKDPCLSSSQTCFTPTQYVYFDSLHPTTRMHGLIGDWVISSIADVNSSQDKKK